MSTIVGLPSEKHSPDIPVMEDVTSGVSGHPAFRGHEQVIHVTDADSGLNAYIAIHNTTLGPAMGGTRVWPYASEGDALTDVLRLSEGMTMKAAMAGTGTGGGKAVIIADPREKTEELLHAYGRAVDAFGGRFITGEDVGLTVADADLLSRMTNHVLGSSDKGGDPAPATALGVYLGIRAAVRHRLGKNSLAGIRIAVQGLGNVGSNLIELLARDGAALTVADINGKAVLEAERLYDATAVSPDEIAAAEVDVFAPCALGGVMNDDTIGILKAKIVAGSANNQLLEPRHGKMLADAGILYAPDYVVNGGGLIALCLELDGSGYSWPRARERVSRIGPVLRDIFDRATAEKSLPEEVADRMALERIRAAGNTVATE